MTSQPQVEEGDPWEHQEKTIPATACEAMRKSENSHIREWSYFQNIRTHHEVSGNTKFTLFPPLFFHKMHSA
jgi:hypothetical protein